MSQSNTPDTNVSDKNASLDMNALDTNASDTDKVLVMNNSSNNNVSMDTFINYLRNSFPSILKSNEGYKSYSDIERDFKYVDSLPPADLNILQKDFESIKIICLNIMKMCLFGKHIAYYQFNIIYFIYT